MVEGVLGRAAPARTGGGALVIAGASLGTLFEWYDFFLYGALASDVARHFFAAVDERTGFIFALAAFGAGFIARPFGALMFGRVGDRVGRKTTFLVTMTIMGASTFLVGLLPDYAKIGVAAPILLVSLRVLQGLAIGGEYGGAAIYVGEHAPAHSRGLHTSWINTMATGGLLTALLVIVAFRLGLSQNAFGDWGWRAPFLVSAALLAVSVWVRMKLGESPMFRRMKAEGGLSRAPFSEAFGRWSNVKLVLAAMFGPVIGQAVIWYSAGFYALFFLQRVLKVADLEADLLITAGLALAAPTYPLGGWLSDRIGRRPVMITGCALGAAAVLPLFHALTWAANPALAEAQRSAPVVVIADPAACSLQFDPVGANHFDTTGCDIAKAYLSKAGVSYHSLPAAAGGAGQVRIGPRVLDLPNPRGLAGPARKAAISAFAAEAKAALAAVGYPAAADPARIDAVRVVLIVMALVSIAALIYGPMAACLVELFPTRIRYTSLSAPYHIGAGWVGGLMPAAAFAIVTANGDIYAGLWYPVLFVALSFVVCLAFLPETCGQPMED